MQTIELLIAEEYESLRRMRCLIQFQWCGAWRVCCEAADEIGAVQKSKRLDPQVVVMGFNIPPTYGLHAVRQICRELASTRIILIGETLEIGFVRGVQDGADEFITRDVVARYGAQLIAARIRASEIENPREHGLDKTLADTFPCSDPLSSIPNPDFASPSENSAEDAHPPVN